MIQTAYLASLNISNNISNNADIGTDLSADFILEFEQIGIQDVPLVGGNNACENSAQGQREVVATV